MENEFGKKIKDRRLELGFSLRKVRESVHNEAGEPISISYLNDIEQGYRKPPKGNIVVKLAEVLKLDPQELLNLAGKMDPLIEDAVSKEAKVGVLFRQIVEHLEQDPDIIEKLKKQLDEESNKKDDAMG